MSDRDHNKRVALEYFKAFIAGDKAWWDANVSPAFKRHDPGLPYEVIGIVDAAIAPMLGHEAAGRIIDVAEATIIKADPDLHLARTEEERQRRHVTLSRTDEAGLRTVIARISAIAFANAPEPFSSATLRPITPSTSSRPQIAPWIAKAMTKPISISRAARAGSSA